jgi:predicted ATPase
MIKQITIQHFFSFGKQEPIPLNMDTNILVGINGSGKSNFIKAIRLLYESIAGNGFQKLFSQKWGGFAGAVHFGVEEYDEILLRYEFDKDVLNNVLNNPEFEFRKNPVYEIRIHKRGIQGEYSLSEWLFTNDPKHPTPYTYLKIDKGQGIISEREKADRTIKIKRIDAFDKQELVLRQISDPDHFYPIYNFKKAIELITIYDYFDSTFESPIRQLSPYFSEERLLPDGRNLSFLLNHLNASSTSAYDQIIQALTNVNPHFRSLVFSTPTAGKTLLSLKEKNLEKTITIEHISDGTLRFLLLSSIFYNPNRGSVICLDEPEIGLHPDMINAIGKGIQYAANSGSQMIVATHSPLLMNEFMLEDLRIFEKDKTNQTVVNTKSEEDFKGWEGEFLVGQMWLRGQVGGVRW